MFWMVDVWSCALGVRGQSVEPWSRMFLTCAFPSLHPPSLHRPSHRSTRHCSRLLSPTVKANFGQSNLDQSILGQCGVCVCCVIVRPVCLCARTALPNPCAGPPKNFALFFPFSLPFAFFLCLWGSSREILVVFFEGRETQMCTFWAVGLSCEPRQLGSCVEGAPCIFGRRPQWLCVQWPLGSEAGHSQARHGPSPTSHPSVPDKLQIIISPGDSKYLVPDKLRQLDQFLWYLDSLLNQLGRSSHPVGGHQLRYHVCLRTGVLECLDDASCILTSHFNRWCRATHGLPL